MISRLTPMMAGEMVDMQNKDGSVEYLVSETKFILQVGLCRVKNESMSHLSLLTGASAVYHPKPYHPDIWSVKIFWPPWLG